MPSLIKACLNGGRPAGSIPGLPVTPAELAADARAAVAAGAGAIHVHPRDAEGHQRLDASAVGAAVQAIRGAVPGVPVGVTTGAWIEPDVARRLELIGSWEVLPDFASVNFHEDGAEEIALLLIERGVGVEAGLWRPEAAERFVASGLAERCLRVLLEPMEQAPADPLTNAGAMQALLDEAGVGVPRLLHGIRATAWPVLRAALESGLDTRIGFEDTAEMPDGARAPGNAALVAAAVALRGRADG